MILRKLALPLRRIRPRRRNHTRRTLFRQESMRQNDGVVVVQRNPAVVAVVLLVKETRVAGTVVAGIHNGLGEHLALRLAGGVLVQGLCRCRRR